MLAKRRFLAPAAASAGAGQRRGVGRRKASRTDRQLFRPQSIWFAANRAISVPTTRLSLSLGAAGALFPGKIAGSKRDGEIYNSMRSSKLVAALRERTLRGPRGRGSGRVVQPHDRTPRRAATRLDPAAATAVNLSADVRLKDLEPCSAGEGAGVPLVFCYDRAAPFLKKQPGVSRFGIFVPVTAFLDFDGVTARLSFYNRLEKETCRGGR